MSDPVNHPEHYTASSIECIDAIRAALTPEEWRGFIKGNALKYVDAIRAALTPEEWRGFIKGNALKYVWRERLKGADQDLAKAVWYLTHLHQ